VATGLDQRAQPFFQKALLLGRQVRGKNLTQAGRAGTRSDVDIGVPGHRRLPEDIDMQLQMDLVKANFLEEHDQIPFSEIGYGVVLDIFKRGGQLGVAAAVQEPGGRRDSRGGWCEQKACEGGGVDGFIAVDWLGQRDAAAGLEDAMEAADGCFLIGDIGKNGAAGDGVSGFICDTFELLGGCLKESTPIAHTLLGGALLGAREQRRGDVDQDCPQRGADSLEGAERDEPVTCAYIDEDRSRGQAGIECGSVEHAVANARDDGPDDRLVAGIAAVPAVQQPV